MFYNVVSDNHMAALSFCFFLAVQDLASFVEAKVDEARDKMEASVPPRRQVHKIIASLRSEYGIRRIVTSCDGGALIHLSALKRLKLLLSTFVFFNEGADSASGCLGVMLRGHEVVLGSTTGIDAIGRVCLGCFDVPDQWAEVSVWCENSDKSFLQVVCILSHKCQPARLML